MTDGRGTRRFGRDWGVDHLSVDAVVAYVDEELSVAAHGRAARHVESCPDCAGEVVAQRQVRSALQAADEPRAPSSLMSRLGSIPLDAELPGPPPGLAVTADGEIVSVLRPDRNSAAAGFGAPAGLDRAGYDSPAFDSPAFDAPSFDPAPVAPAQSRRRLRVGVTAFSGLALGALTFVGLPAAGTGTPPAQDTGVLGGSVLGTPGAGTARLNTGPSVQPAAVVRSSVTPSATPEPGR